MTQLNQHQNKVDALLGRRTLKKTDSASLAHEETDALELRKAFTLHALGHNTTSQVGNIAKTEWHSFSTDEHISVKDSAMSPSSAAIGEWFPAADPQRMATQASGNKPRVVWICSLTQRRKSSRGSICRWDRGSL